MIPMHREIMQTPPGMVCDHIDGNGMDNCRFNLRNCTRQQNLWNRAKRLTDSACKYKGVFRDPRRGKIFAKIDLPDGPLWLGYFDDEESAARAYDFEAVKWFREFAHPSFPEEWPPSAAQKSTRSVTPRKRR